MTLKRKDLPKEMEDSLLYVPFLGAHQAVNAAVATMALSIIMKQDQRINENDLREGLARPSWQGRFEIHTIHDVTYVLDGAHNPAGAEALQEALQEQYPKNRRLLVFTSLADKDTETVIQMLVRKDDIVFACEAPTPRTRKTKEIGDMIEAQHIKAEFHEEPSVREALEAAAKTAKKEDIVLVCGSLYILGDAIRFIEEKEMAAKQQETESTKAEEMKHDK